MTWLCCKWLHQSDQNVKLTEPDIEDLRLIASLSFYATHNWLSLSAVKPVTDRDVILAYFRGEKISDDKLFLVLRKN